MDDEEAEDMDKRNRQRFNKLVECKVQCRAETRGCVCKPKVLVLAEQLEK